jgi:nicotinate-nucleotide pyrophosphorylase (carboxylating)
LRGTNTKLLYTRKTIPGLRLAQKYAVHCAGGTNHRIGLYDAYLIKENHIAACGSIANAVSKARGQHPEMSVEVEVETLDQLNEAIACQADIAMLDNFSLADVEEAVTIGKNKIKLEVSGNIGMGNIYQYASLGVDYISVGGLTKNIQAVDYSMRFSDLA